MVSGAPGASGELDNVEQALSCALADQMQHAIAASAKTDLEMLIILFT